MDAVVIFTALPEGIGLPEGWQSKLVSFLPDCVG